jgi:hypothetical protein
MGMLSSQRASDKAGRRQKQGCEVCWTNEGRDKACLITGITDQDGSYLTELLLTKDYEVHGIIRRASAFNRESPRRGETFVTWKITRAVAHIKAGLQDKLDGGATRPCKRLLPPDTPDSSTCLTTYCDSTPSCPCA